MYKENFFCYSLVFSYPFLYKVLGKYSIKLKRISVDSITRYLLLSITFNFKILKAQVDILSIARTLVKITTLAFNQLQSIPGEWFSWLFSFSPYNNPMKQAVLLPTYTSHQWSANHPTRMWEHWAQRLSLPTPQERLSLQPLYRVPEATCEGNRWPQK